jgi:FixJ family two-component response regulator
VSRSPSPSAINENRLTLPTVFIVDDEQQLRDSLQALLAALGYSVRCFAGAQEFFKFYHSDYPGCLLLDVRMPGQTGLELYERLLSENKRLPVIFMTAHADVSTAVTAMKSGAIEFLEKPFERAKLQTSIERALALDASWRQREHQYAALQDRINKLRPHDRETLALLLAGHSNKVMAAKLLLSERAVEMRRANLMRKLQVDSVAELYELALTHRILTDLRHAHEQSPPLAW